MSKTSELPGSAEEARSLKFKLTYARVLSLSVDRTPRDGQSGQGHAG